MQGNLFLKAIVAISLAIAFLHVSTMYANAEVVTLVVSTGDGTLEGISLEAGGWLATDEAKVLIIKAFGGVIHPPANNPPYYLSGGDEYICSSEIGEGFPFDPANGRFTTIIGADRFSYIYARAFNSKDISLAGLFGESELFYVSDAVNDFDTWNIGGSADTNAFFANKVFDVTPPGAPVSFAAACEPSGNIYLSWHNTVEAGLASIEVWYKAGGPCPTLEGDGIRLVTKLAVSDADDSYTHSSGLVNGVTYYYSIFSVDVAHNFSTDYATASATSLDTISPEVISASPLGGGISIYSPTIRVYFSEAMSRESVQNALNIYPATPSKIFSWSTNSRTVEVNPGTLLNGTTYTVSVGAGAKDVHGNGLDPTPEAYPNAYTFSFTTAAAPPDIVSPTISNVLIDGRRALANDVVSSSPKLSALISDEVALSQIASIEILANGVQKYYGSPGTAFNTATGTFEYAVSLGEGSYTLTFKVWDLSGNPTEESLTIRVFGDEVGVVGPVLNYPNPFSPARGVGTSIAYTLKSDFEVTLYIYDIGAHLVFKKSYPQGGEGGRAGYNEVYWNGKNVYGEYVSNGIFVLKLVGDGKVLKTSKITVID